MAQAGATCAGTGERPFGDREGGRLSDCSASWLSRRKLGLFTRMWLRSRYRVLVTRAAGSEPVGGGRSRSVPAAGLREWQHVAFRRATNEAGGDLAAQDRPPRARSGRPALITRASCWAQAQSGHPNGLAPNPASEIFRAAPAPGRAFSRRRLASWRLAKARARRIPRHLDAVSPARESLRGIARRVINDTRVKTSSLCRD